MIVQNSSRNGEATISFTMPKTDLPVPGEPYGFAQLIRAQADGDLQTLRSHDLTAVRAGKENL